MGILGILECASLFNCRWSQLPQPTPKTPIVHAKSVQTVRGGPFPECTWTAEPSRVYLPTVVHPRMRAVSLPERQWVRFIRMCNYWQSQIIRNNYKKIFNNIFNSKRRDFINSLYDLLRLQDLPAFKLLRELFRIARIHYALFMICRCLKYIEKLPKETPSTSLSEI